MNGVASQFDPPLSFGLPAPATTNKGRVVILKQLYTGGNITISVDGGALIDGSSTSTLSTLYSSRTFICNGTGWDIIK
jgi:hypothetical protein